MTSGEIVPRNQPGTWINKLVYFKVEGYWDVTIRHQYRAPYDGNM